jgi:hypothetical protein
MSFPAVAIKQVTLPCGLPAVSTWVAIQLLDQDGKPVPGAKYHIVFPDGTEKKDVLDGDGYAYFEGITPGECAVAFPELGPFHSFQTSLIPTSKKIDSLRSGGSGNLQPKAPETITIKLEGDGVDDAEFQIELPNGDVARGFLDKGMAVVPGIEPGGMCKVSFPGIHGDFVKPL